MSATPDISAILAALAARPSGQPAQAQQQQPPSQQLTGYPNPTPPNLISSFDLPPPTNSGSLDLSSIKPINSGSVSIQDALAKARGFAAQKGLSYDVGRPAQQDDPRLGARPYVRSRSRSRSPPRRDNMRDSYNPYRDERREDPRRGGAGYGRDRSRSPRGRNTFSPPRAAYGGRERSPPPNDNSEVILIDSSLVGLVIGRQGESLRRIEQESGTRIQFINGPDSGPQRQCRITGSPGARIAAKREINRIIEENGGNPARETGRGGRAGSKAAPQQQQAQPALREGEQSSQIMVPDRTVGLIIGRGGETIRDLQERSGCHVNIVGENKSVNGLRPVNLIGSPVAAARAKELIMEIVDSDTKTMGEAGGAPPAANANPNTNRRDNFDPYSGGANKINDTIMVPSDAVGMIIGKGGETIKEMQSSTGCKINVTQASGADIEREIGLVGTRQAIDDAKKAIWDKVNSVKEKNGGGYGGGGNKRGGGRDDTSYNDYSHQQQQPSYGQPQAVGQSAPQIPAAAPTQEGGAADPYAIYGGYQNYLAMWYSSFAQQQQQGGQGPPGA